MTILFRSHPRLTQGQVERLKKAYNAQCARLEDGWVLWRKK